MVKYETFNSLKINGTMEALQDKITKVNCILVLEHPQYNNLPKEVKYTALKVLKSNLPSLLNESGMISSSFIHWNKDVWAAVLKVEGTEKVMDELKEEVLFLNFLRWKNDRNLKKDDVKYLVHLIRFPLMSEGFLSLYVENSGLLSDSDLLNLLFYVRDDNPTGRIPPFPRSQRRYKLMKTFQDFQYHLSFSPHPPGDSIKLQQGTMEFDSCFFQGLRKLRINGVAGKSTTKLKFSLRSVPLSPLSNPQNGGASAGVMIKKSFYLKGDDLTITNLEFVSSDDVNSRCEVVIQGRRNSISNLRFHGVGLRIYGKSNEVKNISFLGTVPYESGSGNAGPVLIIDHMEGEEQSGWNNVRDGTFQKVLVQNPLFIREPNLHNKTVNNNVILG